MLLLALSCYGIQITLEEKLLQKFQIDPFMIVGAEGMWGCLFYSIVLPIFQKVTPCTSKLCNNNFLENSSLAFQEQAENPILIVYTVIIVISSGAKDAAGVTITKYASGAHRSTIITSRIIIVWIISLCLGYEIFLPLQLVGFFILLLGIFVYNEIIVFP